MLAADRDKIITSYTRSCLHATARLRDMKATHKNIPKLGENMCVIPSEAYGRKRAQ